MDLLNDSIGFVSPIRRFCLLKPPLLLSENGGFELAKTHEFNGKTV
jgi:hypothetical protein